MNVLNRFLEIEFRGLDFSETEKEFIFRYAIERKETSANKILQTLGVNQGYDNFREADNNKIKNVLDALSELWKLFKTKQNKYLDSFDGKFEEFISWRIAQKTDGMCHCWYCGIDDATVKKAFNSGVISSKKRSFSGTLQIERLDPDKGYNSANCRYACVLCNNAKSDMISSADFKKYIAPGIAEYWENIKGKII